MDEYQRQLLRNKIEKLNLEKKLTVEPVTRLSYDLTIATYKDLLNDTVGRPNSEFEKQFRRNKEEMHRLIFGR